MNRERVIVVGGGAAGFFAAITCAEAASGTEVVVLEKTARFLDKVRISGGGRCNVTHSCFDPRHLIEFYPRGGRALLAPFQQFQPRDTIAWFESRGVKLKTESDGRIFPITDSSQTVIDCLLESARKARVILRRNTGVESIETLPNGHFELRTITPPAGVSATQENVQCTRVLLATGGCRSQTAGQLAVSLGHSLEPPVPSLFTLHIHEPWLHELAGISVDPAEVSVQDLRLRERGPLLITHWGLSGPAVLRLSAWGARPLHDRDYRFRLLVNWIPAVSADGVSTELEAQRASHASRRIASAPLFSLPARLWEQLVLRAGVSSELRWAALSRAVRHQLVQQLTRTVFDVAGKSLNKEEFVTCGGVRLNEINFKTMESRIRPGLHFAGELLDIDGLTGGFNFQAAWTTGWIAGMAMSR